MWKTLSTQITWMWLLLCMDAQVCPQYEALKNVFPHWSHVYSFSLVWMFVCFSRVDDCEKLFPHWSQVNGFSPVWTLMCDVRYPFNVKLFPHWSHVYGFSPVWILSCVFRSWMTESLVTVWTLQWFLSSMNSHVNIKIIFACETRSTLSAGEIFLDSWFS